MKLKSLRAMLTIKEPFGNDGYRMSFFVKITDNLLEDCICGMKPCKQAENYMSTDRTKNLWIYLIPLTLISSLLEWRASDGQKV